MIPVEKVVDNFLMFGCFILATYFTATQFIRYGKNEDLSLVSFRKLKFDSESKDQYPTYTVCFEGGFERESIFKRDSQVWTPTLTTYKTYRDFLLGYIGYRELTANTTYTDIMQTFSEIKFEDAIIDLNPDILVSFRSFNKKGLSIRHEECPYQNADCIKPLFLKSHQSPMEMCYSRKFYYETDLGLAYDKLILNASKLNERGLDLRIYVHPEFQLMRHRSDETTSVSSLKYYQLRNLISKNNKGLYHEITHIVNDVVVLRKREKGMIPCHKRWFNEDENWRHIIMKTVGCFPAYWVTFASNSTSKKKIPNCTPNQYHYIFRELHATRNFFKNISQLQTNPCTEMERVVITKSTTTAKKYLDYFFISLRFKYDSERYMEILNNQAFDDETLLSQVGGFIGM